MTTNQSQRKAANAMITQNHDSDSNKTPNRLDFAELLALLGHTETDRLIVCHQPVGGKFTPTQFTGVTAAAKHVDALPLDADVWFGVNSLHPNVLPGHKGTADQIADLAALWADLDVAEGKCPDNQTAHLIIDALSQALGTPPTAVVFSGHGWQPYWRLDDDVDDAPNDFGPADAKALMVRWGKLVTSVAAQHGAPKVDGVPNLDRIMRVPGTVNCKEPDARVETFAQARGGRTVSVTDVQGVLDAHGITAPNAGGETTDVGHVTPSTGHHSGELFSRGRLIARVAKAPNGRRNTTLFGAVRDALKQGDWDTEMRDVLKDSAAKAGLPDDEIRSTVASATKGGACKPFYPDSATVKKFLKRIANLVAPRPNTGMRPELQDAKISAYIAKRYLGKRYCYSASLGWMRWSGTRWIRVGDETVTEAVRLAVLAFHREEANLFQSGAITSGRLTETTRLLSTNKIGAITRLSRGVLLVTDDDWDSHPDLLNCANGIVDLRTGTLRDHDPDLMFTKLCPTEYRSGTTHPDWTSALGAVREDTREWLRQRFGQASTGHAVPDDVLLVLKGDGENGKTTLVGGIKRALGTDYAIILSEKALLARPSDHSTELMPLRGARMALVEELPELGHLNVKRLKTLLGTQDITARFICQDPTTFSVTHSPFVTTNYLPRVDESDWGTWRRLRAVDFPYRYRKPHEPIEKPSDRTGDPGLRERIKNNSDKQHEAILAWLVHGAMAWYASGRTMPADPPSVERFTRRWRRGADQVVRFLQHALTVDPEHHMMSTDVFALFSRWQKDSGHMPWSDQTFAARFAAHDAVTAASVQKKIVRRSRKGLARPELTDSTVPQQYTAWVGVRPRRDGDPIDDDEDDQP